MRAGSRKSPAWLAGTAERGRLPRTASDDRRIDAVSKLESKPALPPSVSGALYVAGAAFCYAITAACIRVMSHELNPFMIGFLRNTFGLLFFSLILWRASSTVLQGARWPVHIVRTMCAIISGLLFFWALARVPLADAIALNFAAPIFVALAAVALLGEHMGVRRWLATAVGFAGVLIIVRPGFQEMSLGLAAALGAALFWGGMVLCNKVLTRTDTMAQIVLLHLFIAAPASFLLALPAWQTPSWHMVLLGAIQGLLGTTAHYLVARGFRIADASHIMPFDFLRLPFTIVIAYLLFSETPDLATVAGAAVIFSATTYIALRERKAAERQPPDKASRSSI